MTQRIWPTRGAAWLMVAFLTIAYVLSYVDRQILGLLIEPIKHDIHMSDEKIGYLIGPAFALFYATIGLPLGWLADRNRRSRIVAAGIALWSLATMASGLASSFWQLFIARMSVGIGEATLSPCAMSMIADSFPPERRGKPIAVYSMALGLGAGISSLVGALVLTWAKTSAGFVVPLIGVVQPWQFAFLVVGMPGIIMSLVFLLIREPVRQAPASTLPKAGFGDMISHIWAERGAFLGLISLVCVMTIIAYSQSFGASAFARKFHWEPKDYAWVNGVMTLAISPLSIAGIGALCDRWRKDGRVDAPFALLAVSFIVMIIADSAAWLMPSPMLTFVCLGIGTIAIGAVTATGSIALLDITPAAIRGQVVAVYYMLISITGLGLGPTTVGLLSTRVLGEGHLHEAIAMVPLIYGLVPLILLPFVRRRYLAELAGSTANQPDP